jgi:predicted GIY-YIG superfamily endonuclease
VPELELIDAAISTARDSFWPWNADDGYWQDAARGRSRFFVYVNLRSDGSLYVGQTGRSPTLRLWEHRRRDALHHVRILATVSVGTRGEALGLESRLVACLRQTGFDAAKTHAAA